MKLLPVRGYLAITNDCNCEVTDHGGAHVTGGSYHLHHYAWWARCFASLHLWDSLLNHISLCFEQIYEKKKKKITEYLVVRWKWYGTVLPLTKPNLQHLQWNERESGWGHMVLPSVICLCVPLSVHSSYFIILFMYCNSSSFKVMV